MRAKNSIAVVVMAFLLCFMPTIIQADTQQTSHEQSEIDSLKKRVTILEKTLEESTPEKAESEKLGKIKVSGYIQTRYETYQTPDEVTNLADNKTLDDRFYLRRGRFKIKAQPTHNTLGVVQLDISGYDRSKSESKDLYLEYYPWGVGTPAQFFVRIGQQNWPFGYIIERSSSAREVPERPKVFAGTTVSLPGYPSFPGLFPGERDKGVAFLSTKGSKVNWALGLFNGTGTKSGDPGKAFLESGGKFEDNNSVKTIVGRIRYPVTESLDVGVSGYFGSQGIRTVSDAPSAVNVDQNRWGLDFQYCMEGSSIKGEYVTGKEPYYSNTSTTPNGKSGTNRIIKGWYLVGVKNLDEKNQLVVQYDVLDDPAMADIFGKLSTWNLGWVHYLDDATKLKVFYEINDEEINEVRNNGLRIETITVF